MNIATGRWRKIVLGDVLAEHVLELRGRALVWLASSGAHNAKKQLYYRITRPLTQQKTSLFKIGVSPK